MQAYTSEIITIGSISDKTLYLCLTNRSCIFKLQKVKKTGSFLFIPQSTCLVYCSIHLGLLLAFYSISTALQCVVLYESYDSLIVVAICF